MINGRASLMLVLLVLCLITAGWSVRAWAGSGIVTEKTGGRVVNLTVYFDDKGQDQAEWTRNLKETHKMLWKATRGLLRLGEVRLGTDLSVKRRADIRIDKIGHAAVSQPDHREKTSLGTGDVLYLFEEDLKHPVITLHELGHYLFCLSDEYKCDVYSNEAGKVQPVVKGDEESSYCSVERASPRESTVNPNHSCVMYDNDTPKVYYMFCGAEHLKRNDLPDGRWAITRQQRDNRKSCADTVAAFLGVPTLPAVFDDEPPDTPSIITLKPEKRLGVLIQSSLPDADMKKARGIAVETVKRLRLPENSRGGDSLGVSTFSDSVNVIQDWKELLTQNDVNGAINHINTVQSVSGQVNLEGALRAEMNSIIQSGYAFSEKTIQLFSSASGTVSRALIDELRRNDVVVDVISGNESLKDLSAMTGGDFISMNSVADKAKTLMHFKKDGENGWDDEEEESEGEAAAETTDGYLIADYSGTIQPGRPLNYQLPVDELNDEITIDLSSSGGQLILVLKDPSGVSINLDNPPAGVRVQRTDEEILVSVEEPSPGTWTALVDGSVSAACSLELGGIGDAMGEPDLPIIPVVYPEASRLYVSVENGMAVIGCQVQAVVKRPDGSRITFPMFDDGDLAFHGDRKANDGFYSAMFTQYSGAGEYQVEFRIENRDGLYSTAFEGADVLPDEPPPGPVGPAPAFQRIVHDSFEVEGVPAAGGMALLPPGNLMLRNVTPGQSNGGRTSTVTMGQVMLIWTDTNGGRASTVVQRCLGGADRYREIAAVEAGQTWYKDPSAGTGSQVFYRLVARTSAGYSQPGGIAVFDAEKAAMMAATAGSGAGSRGFCFIATAAYGSCMDPHVQVLRDFRDRILMRSGPGRIFINLYYRISPPLAEYMQRHQWSRLPVRMALTPIVYSIKYPVPAALGWAALAVLALFLARRRRFQTSEIVQGRKCDDLHAS